MKTISKVGVMRYNDFLKRIQELGSLTREEAIVAAQAFFETLGARLAPLQVEVLTAQLPPGLAESVTMGDYPAARYNADAFFEYIGQRTLVDTDEARARSLAVWAALTEILPGDQLDAIRSQLSEDINNDLE
jgi:uncharacterized protein (DUF2267 family)